jgi:hypothetical protein
VPQKRIDNRVDRYRLKGVKVNSHVGRKEGMNYGLGYYVLGRIAENEEKNGPNLERAF